MKRCKKRKYIKPNIDAIELDPEQSIFAACVAAASVWMDTFAGGRYCVRYSGAMKDMTCTSNPRGTTGNRGSVDAGEDHAAAPS